MGSGFSQVSSAVLVMMRDQFLPCSSPLLFFKIRIVFSFFYLGYLCYYGGH